MKWCVVIIAVVSTCVSAVPEKVLFGQPSSSSPTASIPAEARSSAGPTISEKIAKSSTDGRHSRVISFPSQDSRSRPYGTNTGHVYDTTEERYDLSAATQPDENRLLSLLPTFGDNGMQVGLDFKLPFFSIPYSKLFAGLRGPSSGGFFGSGAFGSSEPAYGTTEDLSNSLGTGIPGSGLATMAAMAVTAALLYPKITNIFSPGAGKGSYRTAITMNSTKVESNRQFLISGRWFQRRKRTSTKTQAQHPYIILDLKLDTTRGTAQKPTLLSIRTPVWLFKFPNVHLVRWKRNEVEDLMQNVNGVLNQFNVDGESCMRVALCSLGNSRRGYVRGRDNTHTTAADIIEDLLNLPAVKSMLAKGGLVQARDFGGSGGDCDYFNNENKCPVTSQTWHKMLASISS